MKKKAIEYSLKSEKKDFPIMKINSAKDAVIFSRKFYFDDINIYESSFIIFLNHANNAVGYAKISQGGLCNTVVDIRIVCKYAIDVLAPAVIFMHNHPSGITKPSNEDKIITKRLHEALKIIDVKLLDSIVVTENDYLSLNEEGLM